MRAIAWPFLVTWLLTGLLAGVFVLAGHRLLELLGVGTRKDPRTFALGRAFFVGLSLHLAVFRVLEPPLGAAVACWTSLASVAALSVVGRRRTPLASPAALAAVPLLWAMFTVTTLAWWQPLAEEVNAFAHLGSIHSGRYANLALYIVEENHVPRLNQPYGQSLLTATNLLLGAPWPVASLASWLPACLAFFALLLHGLFRRLLTGGRMAALLATFLVLFSNLALATTHVLSLDNGSPLGMLGYSDAIAGAATWVLFVLWWYRWRRAEVPSRSLALAVVLAFVWTMSAAHDLVLVAALLGIDLLVAAATRRLRRAAAVTLAVGVATAAGCSCRRV